MGKQWTQVQLTLIPELIADLPAKDQKTREHILASREKLAALLESKQPLYAQLSAAIMAGKSEACEKIREKLKQVSQAIANVHAENRAAVSPSRDAMALYDELSELEAGK
jgi:shikimate kinase